MLTLVLVLVGAALLLVDLAAIARRELPPEREIQRSAIDDRWTALYPPRYRRTYQGEPDRPIEAFTRRAAFARGEALAPVDLDDLIVDAAFDLEFRARRVLADQQFRGILRGRHTIVWSGSDGDELLALLRRHRPGPEARAHLDRALAWWSAARRAGARVFEWDEDGYDEVTSRFDGLEGFAESAAPIDPEDHGVLVRTWTETQRPAAPPFPWHRLCRALAVAIGILVLLLLRDRGSADTPARGGDPPTCAEHQATARGRAARLAHRRPDLRPRLDPVLAALDAGDPARAEEIWRDHGDDPEERLLGAQLFIASSCAAPRPAPGSSP